MKRRQTLDRQKVETLAQSILARGQDTPFLCGQTAAGVCWWRGCIDWRPVGLLERRLCPPISFRPGSIELTVAGDAPEAIAQVRQGAVIGRCEGTKERRAKQ